MPVATQEEVAELEESIPQLHANTAAAYDVCVQRGKEVSAAEAAEAVAECECAGAAAAYTLLTKARLKSAVAALEEIDTEVYWTDVRISEANAKKAKEVQTAKDDGPASKMRRTS